LSVSVEMTSWKLRHQNDVTRADLNITPYSPNRYPDCSK